MTEVERILQNCPPEVLFTYRRPRRLGRLERWCRNRGITPTLLEIENERNRRRLADTEGKKND